jgi:hypothetical protein
MIFIYNIKTKKILHILDDTHAYINTYQLSPFSPSSQLLMNQSPSMNGQPLQSVTTMWSNYKNLSAQSYFSELNYSQPQQSLVHTSQWHNPLSWFK